MAEFAVGSNPDLEMVERAGRGSFGEVYKVKMASAAFLTSIVAESSYHRG